MKSISLLAAIAILTCAEASAQVTSTAALSSGGRQTGGTVVIDSSLGAFTGIASGGTATARHGYAGQIYDATSVGITATTTDVNENATTQLSVTSVMDDDTALPLNATDVSWSIVDGPLHSISSSGLVAAANVYTATSATVQGAFQSAVGTLGLQILNVTDDDFGNYANDNLPDPWQVQYFGDSSTNAGPTMDPDGDGQPNSFEYVAGTWPHDINSKFLFYIGNLTSGSREIVFRPSIPGRNYTLEYRDSFSSGSFTPLTGATVSDINFARTTTDTAATDSRFYRVQITLP